MASLTIVILEIVIESLFGFSHVFSRGRNAGYPAPPAQIRTGSFPASGSYLR